MWWMSVAMAAVDGEPDALAERKVGLGVGTSFTFVSSDFTIPPFDRFGLRWQVGPRLALDPALQVVAQHTWDGLGEDDDRPGPSVAADLTMRAYVGQHGMAHLAALVGSTFRTSQYDVEAGPRSSFVDLETGLSVELAPEPWIAVSTDLRTPLVYVWTDSFEGDTTSTLGVSLGWRPWIGAMVHVFF